MQRYFNEEENLVGGGAPFCPCLYVVQVFPNSPVARDGSMTAGDEIIAVNEVRPNATQFF